MAAIALSLERHISCIEQEWKTGLVRVRYLVVVNRDRAAVSVTIAAAAPAWNGCATEFNAQPGWIRAGTEVGNHEIERVDTSHKSAIDRERRPGLESRDTRSDRCTVQIDNDAVVDQDLP